MEYMLIFIIFRKENQNFVIVVDMMMKKSLMSKYGKKRRILPLF